MMSWPIFISLLPLIFPAAAAVVIVGVLAFVRSHVLTASIALVGLFGGLASIVVVAPSEFPLAGFVAMDGAGRFFVALIIAAAIVTLLFSYDYFRRRAGRQEEFYVLLLLATVGASALAASTHLVWLFMGLELLSISLYAMIAYERSEMLGIEAGLKYLVLAAGSSALLLMGMALIYAAWGSLAFVDLRAGAAGFFAAQQSQRVVPFAGMALMVVGLGFKLAAVPLHLWTPDVYQGSPAPVAGFIATASKAAALAVLLRLSGQLGWQDEPAMRSILQVLAIASMLGGNLLALLQSNLKRLLAYSSVAHIGYLLVPLLAYAGDSTFIVSFYLVAYFAATLTAFGVISVLLPTHKADELSDYHGLFYRRPALAIAMTIALLSLAGIPLTAGFMGKFFVLIGSTAQTLWALVITLVISSGIGLYYYLRAAFVLYAPRPTRLGAPSRNPLPATSAFVLAALIIAIIAMGIWPSGVMNLLP